MDIKYIEETLKEADRAYKTKNIPVGAVIVYNGRIIAKGHNNRFKKNDVMNHAEIVAIRKAARKMKDWRLSECDLYVTLKPCDMCLAVIKESRIKNVYYLLDKEEYKKSYYRTNVRNINNDISVEIVENYKNKLSSFFKLNCNR